MIVQRDRIRTAVAAFLHKSSNPNGILAFLNKQVAFVNHISFCEPEGESPLGPIRFEIQANNPSKIISWITGGESERLGRRARGRDSMKNELSVDSQGSDPGLDDGNDELRD